MVRKTLNKAFAPKVGDFVKIFMTVAGNGSLHDAEARKEHREAMELYNGLVGKVTSLSGLKSYNVELTLRDGTNTTAIFEKNELRPVLL